MPLTRTGWSAANFVGGALCLDFSNTLSGRFGDGRIERLPDYPHLVEWALAAGVIAPGERRSLLRLAEAAYAEAASIHARAIELREAIFTVVRSPERAEQTALERLNDLLAETTPARALTASAAGYGWRWRPDAPPLARLLGPVALSAASLLSGPELARVRLCEGADCAWLFLDRSKNRSRRWCDMAVCGNRAKARRHYRARTAVR